MKKFLSILAICFSLLTSLTAQNIWKPIDMDGMFLGVSADGSIFCSYGEDGLYRSQDEGLTWAQINGTYMRNFMAISPDNRLFVAPNGQHYVLYSDDNGDTWQQTASYPYISNYQMSHAYAVNNDTLLLWNNDNLLYTLNAGVDWNLSQGFDGVLYDVIANEAGNVYLSTGDIGCAAAGIYQYTFDELAYFGMWFPFINAPLIKHMEFDPEGNVVAGGYGQFQQQLGLYLVPDRRFIVADNGIIYDLHNVGEYTVLRYSADHGETFYEYGEALPLYSPAPGGLGDGSIYKGRDGHLYFSGHGAFKKSVFNTNEIHYIEGEVIMTQTSIFTGTSANSWQAIRIDDDHIYPVTVDGFRQCPYEESHLVVRYDTIPMGTFIGAFGTIKHMTNDYTGSSVDVLDIQQTTAHNYDAITATLGSSDDNKVIITTNYPPYQTYYITINGEKQEFPLTFNGVTLNEGCELHTFIGHCSIQMDQYAVPYYGMELADIQPFKNYNFWMDGCELSTNEWQPELTIPFENQHYLVAVGPPDCIIPYYPMHNGQLVKNTYINNDIFREGTPVNVRGIEHIRYDIEGMMINTFELIRMDTDQETTLTGTVVDAPMPHTGYIPLPGMELAFMANGRRYYLENTQDWEYGEWFLVGNDTIYIGQEITATFTSKLGIDNDLNFYYRINITQAEPIDNFPIGTEWYYEITNDNGSVTYQYLECAADTTINDQPIHILVRINTLYDKSQVITHEYIYEENNKVYWWNKTLGEFTTLYDFGAEVGDEWEIKVGTQTITVHVDAAQTVTYKSQEYKMLSISDPDDIFTGDIICGIGHLTSFFPEKLMNKGFRVENIRCFWQDGELVYQNGDQDCDEIYEQHHLDVDEIDAENGFVVYPNPSHDVLFVLSESINSEYRITNIMGQTLMTGNITSENQMIDVSSLPKGIYFITLTNKTTIYDVSTQKFVIK